MKRLYYKNRFKVLIDLIFRPSVFKSRISDFESEIVKRLEHRFENKLRLISNSHKFNGIVAKDYDPFAKFPIRGKPDPSIYPSSDSKAIETVMIDFSSHKFTDKELRLYAGVELSKELIDKGLVKSVVENGFIYCYINYIK